PRWNKPCNVTEPVSQTSSRSSYVPSIGNQHPLPTCKPCPVMANQSQDGRTATKPLPTSPKISALQSSNGKPPLYRNHKNLQPTDPLTRFSPPPARTFPWSSVSQMICALMA